MAEPVRKPEDSAQDFGTLPEKPIRPTENPTHGMEREPQPTLGEQIRAQIKYPHKGDVGRPGTNEEIYQGSKMKELK
jgi:hypothetical protein